MNFIQEVLNLLDRKQDKKTLELKRDWFEFGRTKASSVGNPLYSPKMTPHAIRFDDLKCEIITGLVQGTGSRYTLPMWDEHDPTNCNVQTMVDSIFSQDAGATEGLVSGNFKVTGNTILEGDLLVLGQQTIVESTVVQVADNIFRINSGGAGVDAGIEVIQPSGTKTWAWDFARGAWSTFGESIITQDITIGNAINMDGEVLVNIVNEAEGLASNDNDASLATVAAIKDYVDAHPGAYVVDVQLIGDDLQFTSVGAAFSGTVNLSKYLDNTDTIDYVSTVVLNGTSLDFTAVGNGFNGSVDLSTLAGASETLTTLTYLGDSVIGVDQLTYTDENGLSHVISGLGTQVLSLSGTDLSIVGADGVIDNTISLAGLGGNVYDLQQASNVNGVGHALINTTTNTPSGYVFFTPGTNMVINQTIGPNGEFFYEFNASGGASVPVMSSTVTGTGKLFSDVVQVTPANPVTDTPNRTYGVQFNDAGQLVVNVPWTTGTGADGNDFISNVTFDSNTSVLDFTGSGGAFNGSINLAALADTETLTSLSRNGDLLIYTDENGSATNVNLSDYNNPDQNLWANIAVAGQQTITANTTTDTLEFVAGAGIQLQTNALQKKVFITNTLTDTNDIDYVSNVALSGTNLQFTSVGNGFSGSVSLATLLDDTNTTYNLGSAQNVSDVDITLTGSDATVDTVKLVAGTNITLTENLGNITIDAAGGGSSYTFGTYLTETSGTVNHDATTRSDSTSTAAPAHGATFTAVDGVTTNATGHVTGINVKTVTLPDASEACIFGNELPNGFSIPVSATSAYIQDNITAIGVHNQTNANRSYSISWTIELSESVGSTVRSWETGLALIDPTGIEQSIPVSYRDSAYMVSESPHTSTYSYTIQNLAHDWKVMVKISGDTSLTVQQATFNAVEANCISISQDPPARV